MRNSYLIYLLCSGLGVASALLTLMFLRRKNQTKADTDETENANVQPLEQTEVETADTSTIKEAEEMLQKTIQERDTLEAKNAILDTEIRDYKERVASLKKEKTILKEKVDEMKKVKNGNTAALIPVEHFFYSEVMVTAGPRKKGEQEIDFGEDTCGIVRTKKKILFWLLDGTSDQDTFFADTNNDDLKIEVFSSRLMVQSISNLLPEIFNENTRLSALELTERAIDTVARKWVNRYQEYKYIFEKGKKCSTTMVVGTLDVNGNLDAYVVGDSTLLSFDANQQFRKEYSMANGGSSTQVFIADVEDGRLHLFTGVDEKGYKKQGAIAKGQHIKGKGICSIICHSDGISKRKSEVLKVKKKENWGSVQKALRKIPVNTEDDKSMLIIELKNS